MAILAFGVIGAAIEPLLRLGQTSAPDTGLDQPELLRASHMKRDQGGFLLETSGAAHAANSPFQTAMFGQTALV